MAAWVDGSMDVEEVREFFGRACVHVHVGVGSTGVVFSS